jgi:hypothetical protein
MSDPAGGLREMARVTRRGGVVAACVWDHASDRGPLSLFWRAARELDPSAPDESGVAGARAGHRSQLHAAAGQREVAETTLTVEVRHPSFEEWWEPFTGGVGHAGAYFTGLDRNHRERLRERCRELVPEAPFTVAASAWAARGRRA